MSDVRFEARKVEKPWGYELIWALTDDYVGKLLFVRAGEALSLQYHEHKDESWYVQQGRAWLEVGSVGQDERSARELKAGDCLRFRPGTIHRVEAHEDTLIVEVSTPQLEDVVRLEDDYGRAGTSAP
jgi:mannose-6-phosphate isomerase-like protein (cupin superfamily)